MTPDAQPSFRHREASHGNFRSASAFTLIELLVVIAIGTVAAPVSQVPAQEIVEPPGPLVLAVCSRRTNIATLSCPN